MQRAEAKRPKADILSDSDDDAPMIESSAWRSKQGKLRKAVDRVCPFLDTVDRRSLDFDFAKVCSVSLSDQHVYACLVCGNYFQGEEDIFFCFIVCVCFLSVVRSDKKKNPAVIGR